MKLRALDKVLLFVGGFLCAVIGLGVFMVGMQAEPLKISDFVGSSFTVNDLWLLAGGALLFVLGVYLIGLPHSYQRKKNEFIVQQTADGEVRISVHAMDGMVRKLMEPRSEIILKSMDVDHRKDHAYVHLKVSVAKNVSIPLAVAALQRDVKQHLLSATGVDVREVKVTVDTSDELAADSPYLMREQPAAPLREEEQKDGEPPAVKPDEPLPSGENIGENSSAAGDETERPADTESLIFAEKEPKENE